MPPSSPGSFTAGDIMDLSASLLNDTAKSVYTYVAQLPYLKMAVDELKLEFQLNNLPITNVTSQIIPIAVGDVQINPPDGSPPVYPGDLTEIQAVWERAYDSNDPWIPLDQYDYIPHLAEQTPVMAFSYFVWQEEIIRLNPAGCTAAREIKLDFISEVIGDITDHTTPIGMINAKNYLRYKTAALCATFVQQNEERKAACEAGAQMALDQVVGINIKGRQSFATRKLPFRAAYKARGYR